MHFALKAGSETYKLQRAIRRRALYQSSEHKTLTTQRGVGSTETSVNLFRCIWWQSQKGVPFTVTGVTSNLRQVKSNATLATHTNCYESLAVHMSHSHFIHTQEPRSHSHFIHTQELKSLALHTYPNSHSHFTHTQIAMSHSHFIHTHIATSHSHFTHTQMAMSHSHFIHTEKKQTKDS